MKKYLLNFALIVFTGVVFYSGCADVEEVTAPQKVTVHEEGINDTASVNFHGDRFNGDSLSTCQSCHAADFSGGTAKVGCASANCHPGIVVHQTGILTHSSEKFHGKYFTNVFDLADCQSCHQPDFSGDTGIPGCSQSSCHPVIGVHSDSVSHPNYFAADTSVQVVDCQQCHGTDYSVYGSPVCSTCHPSVTAHKSGLMTPSDNNFHGTYFAGDNEFSDCYQCHGDDFAGGTAATSCLQCHDVIDVHVTDVTHPNYFAANSSVEVIDCQSCHGNDYTGSTVSPACTTCHPNIAVHQTGLMTSSSQNFHGKYFIPSANDFSDCYSCHGDDFAGGTAATSCLQCHNTIDIHKPGIVNSSSDEFHGDYLIAANWDMTACKNCHGTDYSGSQASSSCLTCHTNAGGPEACNTCHGNFSDPTQIAPPAANDGTTSTSYRGVGSHSSHLEDAQLADVPCETCHDVPTGVDDAGHIDQTQYAEVIFSSWLKTESLTEPVYNTTTLTCSDTYCHGNFKYRKADAPADRQWVYTDSVITGNNRTVTWTSVGSGEAACGTCHGIAPRGHIGSQRTSCYSCHGTVINSSGEIIDKSLHINGEIDYSR